MTKKILVACGTAVAASNVIIRKIDTILEKKGYKPTILQCKAAEVPSNLDGVDLIVTTTPVGDISDIPVIETLSFLTGIGIDADIEKIISYLKK